MSLLVELLPLGVDVLEPRPGVVLVDDEVDELDGVDDGVVELLDGELTLPLAEVSVEVDEVP